MARKNARQTDTSDIYLFDSRTNSVMVKPREDGIKEKVGNVREVVGSGRSTNEIVMVLQYYDNNVEQTIQAFLEDGAKEALGEWNFNGKKAKAANKKKKNRNKNKEKEKPAEGETEAASSGATPEEALREKAGAMPVPELLPAHDVAAVNGHVSPHVNGDFSPPSVSPSPSKVGNPPAPTPSPEASATHSGTTKPDSKPTSRTYGRPSPPEPTKTDSSSARHSGGKSRNNVRNDHRKDPKQDASFSSVDLTSSAEASPSTSTNHSTCKIDISTNNPKNELSNLSMNDSTANKATFSGTRKDTSPIKAEHAKPKREVASSQSNHQDNAKPSRPTSLYTGHNLLETSGRERTLSETSNASSVGRGGDGKNHRLGMEKSVRDLQRQTSSLQRHKLMLNEEIERSFKNMNRYFEEIRNALNDREAELMYAMSKVKDQALDILSKRQKQSGVLKQGTERAQAMNDIDLADLRADIKVFVSDRKFDEELSQTTRFVCDHDAMMEAVRSYGQVVPIRCAYSQRRPSGSSVCSSTDGLLTPTTPSTPAHSPRPTPSPLVSTPVILSNPDRHRAESHEGSTNGNSTSPSSTASQELDEKAMEPKTPEIKGPSAPNDKRGAGSGQGQTKGQGQDQDQGDEAKKTRNARRRKKAAEKRRQQHKDQAGGGSAPSASGNTTGPSDGSQNASAPNGQPASYRTQGRQQTDNRRHTGSPNPNNRYNRNRNGPNTDRSSPNPEHINHKRTTENGPAGDRGPNRGRRQGSPGKRPQNQGSNRPRSGEKPSSASGDGPVIQVNGVVDHPDDGTPAATNGINGSPKKAHVSILGSPANEDSLPQRKPRQRFDRNTRRAEVVVNGNATEEEKDSR